MIAAFEVVLRDAFGLDPVACRESEDWWRFQVEDLKFQGGVHNAEVRVYAVLCDLDPKFDDRLYWEMDQSECPDGLAYFGQADCVLYAKAPLPFESVTEERIWQAILDCVTVARSPAATKLCADWAFYDWMSHG